MFLKFPKTLILATLSVTLAAPPQTWQEHWYEHKQNLTLVYSDSDVAVYFDADVTKTITWPFQYLGDVWRYVRKTYGDFGPENNLYAIFHSKKYDGRHPSTYFDSSHDHRNVIDLGSAASYAWTAGQGSDLDTTTTEIAKVVEKAIKGIHNSPASSIWDAKWSDIFTYDVYLKLNRSEDADRWFRRMMEIRDNFPSDNTYWFRDWFYPIYFQYGQSAVLNNFFVILSKHFPKRGTDYARDMNLGEFVHFWSGAAQTNLYSLANIAFGWRNQWELEFNQARTHFPAIIYD